MRERTQAAPVMPPKHLVASFFLFVLGHEEPALDEQFPEQYKRYRANVRRWIPRTTPWRGGH